MRRVPVLCVLLTLIPAGAAQAKPADGAAAIAAYQAVQADMAVASGWTGSVSGCVVGTESAASLAATLRTINTMRDFSGLGPVSFDAKLNEKALASSLMMKAAGDISHDPEKDWPCYSKDGDEAARKGNLFLGRYGANAMVGYVQDKNIDVLGHRRWLLSPAAVTFGSGSTDSTNTLYVQGQTKAVPANTVVTWPPQGFVPGPWIFDDWSAQIGGSGQKVDTENAAVSVVIDGVPAPVSGLTALVGGYGFGTTLKWKVAGPPGLQSGAHKIDIAISGVLLNGAPLPVSYSVQSVDPGAAPRPALPTFARRPYIRPATGKNRRLRVGMKVRVVVAVTGATKVSYRWRRGGRPIRRAAGRTFRISRLDRGKNLSIQVTARNAAGRVVRTSLSRRVSRR